MYIVVNACKNLVRNIGRNLLIAAVTLVVVASSVVTLTIVNAAANIVDGIRLELGSRVEIRQDFIEMRQSGLGREDVSYVSIDDFLAFADSEYLRTSIFGADMYGWSDAFCAIGDDPYDPGAQERDNGQGEIVRIETCKLISTSAPDTLPDFGTLRAISEGRMFEDLNECIVSEDLARLNGLSPGDTIWLRGAYAADKSYELIITGVYSDATDEYLNPFLAFFGEMFAHNRRNEIITSFETLMGAVWETNAGLDMKTEYYLKDPDDVALFEAEVRAKGLPVTYNVSINRAAYDKVTGPVSGMSGAAAMFAAAVLVLGAIVLALISFIAVRERKYEIGVLRAMGMERVKVALSILAETAMISAVCLVVGLAAGGLSAQRIADGILNGRVAAAEAESEQGPNKALFVGGQAQIGDGTAGYVPESEIKIVLDAGVIVKIIIITLGLAVISGAVGTGFITRFEPLKILRERN